MRVPSYYFPPIAFFQFVWNESNLRISGGETFSKQSWRTRTALLSANGRQLLSLPVVRKNGKDTRMHEVELTHQTDWRKDHWKAIESAYRHAPYFFYYGEQIKALIYQNEINLIRFNTTILQQLLDWLDFTLPLEIEQESEEGIDPLIYPLEQKTLAFPQALYIQVFNDKLPFEPNLSVIDLLLNEGPLARNYITSSKLPN